MRINAKLMLAGLVFSLALPGCAHRSSSRAISVQDPIAREFLERVERYLALRKEAAGDLLPLPSAGSPQEVDAVQSTLARRLRERRAAAGQGSIFTAEARSHFRRLLARQLATERGESIREIMDDDAPAPGAIPLEVNGTYPTSQPYATTPPSFLKLLPPLPPTLEFRFLGRDLVLLDQSANLIVDFMRNAIPPERGRNAVLRRPADLRYTVSLCFTS